MDSQSTTPSPDAFKPSAEGRLDSWKEIAAYLRREVRTVQRWEKSAGLPIHRLQIDKQGPVYAYKEELDSWYRDGHLQLESEPQGKNTRHILGNQHIRSRAAGVAIVLAGVLSVAAYLSRNRFLGMHAAPPKIKLAVLPFKNMSGDPEQEYFSDGMTDEMITQLARLEPKRLGVIARTSVMPYKATEKSTAQICGELGVNYIMEGGVRRTEKRARITAQLVQCADQTHVWANSADRDMADILALQAEAAQAITREVQITLSSEQQTRLTTARPVNPDAYEAYLKGRYCWYRRDPREFQKSVGYFRSAIEKQPDYALAYSSLAMSYAMLGVIPYDALAAKEAMPQARAAAEKALDLDNSLAEARTVLGLVRYRYEWDWQGAEQQYDQALSVQPSYVQAHLWRSWLLLALNRHREALQQIQRAEEAAQETDPRSLVVIRAVLAQALYYARQYDRSIEESKKAIELDPNWFITYFHLARAYEQKGMYAEAVTEVEKAHATFSNVLLFEMELGHAHALAGRKNDALKEVQYLGELAKSRYVPAFYTAAIYIGLGDKDEAFQWLEKAAEEHSDGLAFLGVDPAADSLRSDPRFQALLRRMNFP
ncbi:MAG TPA: tetratricopeptide repeat protein, partial [Candidatus Acidoferrum sp.]|nr:tetratricopeptide repeat protein [Candidatus Acidoferrum sp.]